MHLNHKFVDMRWAILKTIALLCIILAHVKPSPVVFQLRNFDVPLMVLISGALFARSAKKDQINFAEYVRSRFARLVVPVWVFFLFFFALTYILFLGQAYPFSIKNILGTFLFTEKYVWIIRVFLLLAIAAPFLLKLRRSLGNDRSFLIWLSVIYMLYEAAFRFYTAYPPSNALTKIILRDYLFYLLSYGCVFGLGMCMNDMKRRTAILISGVFFMICLGIFLGANAQTILGKEGPLTLTQAFKYPPRLYYLSYAVFVSFLLFGIVEVFKTIPVLLNKLFIFVNNHSLEIYLWHILFLKLWEWFISGSSFPLRNDFAVKFCVILILSLGTVLLRVLLGQWARGSFFRKPI
jgi:peptidoglycan/LPS O-acetylase OafA/YrhL